MLWKNCKVQVFVLIYPYTKEEQFQFPGGEKSCVMRRRQKGKEPEENGIFEYLNGIRVVCLFEDEIYEVVELLKLQKDIEILKIKDYIKDPKKNGYRSLHLIVQVPIYSADGPQKEPVEIQLRTLAMDYWSVLEYQLYYKKSENEEVAAELKEYAEEIARLDGKMLKLRNKIEKIQNKKILSMYCLDFYF